MPRPKKKPTPADLDLTDVKPDDAVEKAAAFLRTEDGDITMLAVDAIVPAPRNANQMSAGRFAQLKGAIGSAGFLQPVLVQPGEKAGVFEIVDGHHRVQAARELGRAEVPVVVLPRGDARIIALSMNRLRGETNLAEAALVIDELVGEGISAEDLDVTGFSVAEINDLIASVRSTEPELDDLDAAVQPDATADAGGSPVDRPFVLELRFRTRVDLAAAKKALRRAAGKGAELADGLLRVVGSE